jgi:ABC-type uncharacterized transport system permease subunit
MEPLTLFLEATVRTAVPLAFAALGECVAERGGVINLGIEGAIVGGAFGSLIGASSFGLAGGVLAAAACGGFVGALFAVFVVALRTNQIITGTAMTLLALGLTGTLYRASHGTTGAALDIPTLPVIAIPVLSSIPIIGRAAFAQPVTTYLLFALVGFTMWWLFRTHAGLALRACGEAPPAARAAGVHVRLLRAGALVYAGITAGLGGGVLVLAQTGTFAEGMSAGRGFVAIAIVVLGRWNPAGAVLAACLFGAASALQILFQASGSGAPYQLFLALPYLLTLLALAGFAGRSRSPAALGSSLDD